MRQLTVVCLLLVLCTALAAAATEQEAATALTQRIQRALAERRNVCAVQELRLTAALTVASDKRDLDMAIARQQLSADLAAGAASMVGADPALQPAQLRAQYVQAINTAMQQFTQVVNASQQEWSTQVNAAFQRLNQDEGAAQQTLNQALSTAQQSATTAIGGIPADVAPTIAEGMPDLTGAVQTDDVIASAEKSIAEARASYRQDVAKALAEGYAELKAAVANTVPAERADGIRAAINKLRLVCLDRYDQYDNEVRSILRKALLAALQ
ncbi:MAG: hypothetical protein HPY69_17600 [Armatimonadetes bacterium]|nr:hypothetical protein [Armatimonadota bacterium]